MPRTQLIPGALLQTDDIIDPTNGLGIGAETLAVARQEGHLNPFRIGKAPMLYRADELIAWIEKVGTKVPPPGGQYRRDANGRRK